MKNVTIPSQFLQELLALCGPEDHELRERVLKSAAPTHPAEGVPAATVANMPADPTEEMLEVLMAGEDRLRARHGDELTKKRAKERNQASR